MLPCLEIWIQGMCSGAQPGRKEKLSADPKRFIGSNPIVLDNTKAGLTVTVPFLDLFHKTPPPRSTHKKELTNPPRLHCPVDKKKKKLKKGCRGGQKRKNGGTPGNNITGHTPTESIKIFSLSKHELTPYERTLLNKGLSFCPNNHVNTFDFLGLFFWTFTN